MEKMTDEASDVYKEHFIGERLIKHHYLKSFTNILRKMMFWDSPDNRKIGEQCGY